MIVHLVKDNRDPDWLNFVGYDERGQSVPGPLSGSDPFSESRCERWAPLKVWREVHGAQLHRGFHPDESRIPRQVSDYLPSKLGRGQFNEVSMYWFETKT